MSDLRKMLYVDDEEINLMVFKAAFSKSCQVLTAENGFEGLELIRTNSDIKFVVSDLKMPEMSGLEFIQEIKKTNKNLPCMLLSGFQQNKEVVEALQNKTIVTYMVKPFNRIEINELLDNYCK